MKSLCVLSCLLAGAALASAQPVVYTGGVVNAASYTPSKLPNGAIAPGSLFLVFGTGLGPTQLASIGAFPLPPTIGGTSIQVVVNGVTSNAYMIYSSASQVAAILPSSTPVGNGTLTVTYNGATSAPAAVQVAASDFGIFGVNQQGTGAGVIYDANSHLFTLSAPARPNDVAVIWGTGLGAVSGQEAAGPLPGNIPAIPVQLFVGSQQVPVSYQGRSGCCAGLDQIVFQIPQGVEGCHAPITVKIGNIVSNSVLMPIAASGPCSDPALTGVADFAKLPTTGNVSVGYIGLSRDSTSTTLPPPLGTGQPTTTTSDLGFADFTRYDAAELAQTGNLFGNSATTFGSCTVYTYKGASSAGVPNLHVTNLDAGPFLTVNGPKGSQQLAKQNMIYLATLGSDSTPAMPLYLDAGNYTVVGTGGADVGPISAQLTLSAPLVWSNEAAVTTISRPAGQLITWTGGNPNAQVTISGSSYILDSSGSAGIVGATFSCVAKVSDGQFTIPAIVLLALPPSSSNTVGGLSFPTGTLSVGTTMYAPFTATGLNFGLISSSNGSGKSVTYQ